MFGKIMCPVDFSSLSKDALRVAARIAAANGSELVIAHVWHFPAVAAAHEHPLPGTTLQLVMEDEKRGLDEAAADARRFGATRITTKFLEGGPWHQLVDLAADDRSIDLIVMGTHGRTGLKRFFLGSVAEKVVRHAPTSVLVIRGTPDGPSFDHVLCPIDFSEDASRIIERAEELANPKGSGLELLHAIELPLAASGDPLLTDFVNDLDRRATNEIERYADEVRTRRRVSVRTEVLTGNPAELTLAKLEEDRTFDLVAVGTHGRSRLRRVLGSVAEKLVRHSPCSVLVVRARA